MHAILVIGAVLGLLAIAGGPGLVVFVVRVGLVLTVAFFAYALYDMQHPHPAAPAPYSDIPAGYEIESTLAQRCSADPSRHECGGPNPDTWDYPGRLPTPATPAQVDLGKRCVVKGFDDPIMQPSPRSKCAAQPATIPAPTAPLPERPLYAPIFPDPVPPRPAPQDQGYWNIDDLTGPWPANEIRPASARAERMLRRFHEAQGVEMDQ